MTQATILEWLKPEGTWVEKGEPLFTLENEKSVLEIESPASGFLHILIPANETAPVLGQIGELSPEKIPVSITSQPISVKQEISSKLTIAISPKARKLAKQLDIDVPSIQGTGPRGMIIARDLPAVAPSPRKKASPLARRIAKEAGLDLAEIAGSGPRAQVMQRDIEKAIQEKRFGESTHPMEPVKTLPLSGLRGIIADRLSTGWRERPQVTLTTEADATYLVALRLQLNEELAPKGIKISYNAILVSLVSKALEEHPNLNVQLGETGIQEMPHIHIGIAVDTERGLLVPVIRDANKKSILNLNTELLVLTERALQGKSLPDDLSGGTFTITNLGAYEIDAFTPIINPPECAILGIGRIHEKPVGVNGQIILRSMLSLSLAFDHRLVDGAPAARFLQRIKQRIERLPAFSVLDP